jgi:hypothetical protein
MKKQLPKDFQEEENSKKVTILISEAMDRFVNSYDIASVYSTYGVAINLDTLARKTLKEFVDELKKNNLLNL